MPIFNLREERLSKNPICMKMPRLALELWLVQIFKAKRKRLGSFLEVDEQFVFDTLRTMTKVLIELDVTGGLAKEIEIEVVNKKYVQPFDRVGIPCHCDQCHSYGHLVIECRLIIKEKFW
jgi:hypothetical protein